MQAGKIDKRKAAGLFVIFLKLEANDIARLS